MKLIFLRLAVTVLPAISIAQTTLMPAQAESQPEKTTEAETLKPNDFCGRHLTEPPAAFLERLIKAEGATVISRGQEFTAVRDKAGVIWNFTTPHHRAHPSVACRKVVMVGKQPSIYTNIDCHANKRACDQLAADYKLLDKRIIDGIKKEHPKK